MSTFETLSDRIRAEAAQASRPGQMARLEALADEVDQLRRGAKTLGEVIESNCRAVLDITGMHDAINEDGDGDWAAVWENLYELPAEVARLTEQRDRAERRHERLESAVEALASEWYPGTPGPRRMTSWARMAREACARDLRAALATEPTP